MACKCGPIRIIYEKANERPSQRVTRKDKSSITHAMAPWEWRRKDEDRGIGQTGFHGNTSSHVFHKPGCKHFNCRNCTVVFKSKDEAVKAGYKPCGMCKP